MTVCEHSVLCRSTPVWRCQATDNTGTTADQLRCPEHAHEMLGYAGRTRRWAAFWRLSDALIGERDEPGLAVAAA